jgi:hypothetical protein
MTEKTKFLRAAISSYPKAAQAVVLVQDLIKDEILASVAPKTPELASKMRIRLSSADWKPDLDGGGIGIRIQSQRHGPLAV